MIHFFRPKSGYWQLEMEEDSKALNVFTVRPLGFYECERMLTGPMNVYCINCINVVSYILMISLYFPKCQKNILLDYEPFLETLRELN